MRKFGELGNTSNNCLNLGGTQQSLHPLPTRSEIKIYRNIDTTILINVRNIKLILSLCYNFCQYCQASQMLYNISSICVIQSRNISLSIKFRTNQFIFPFWIPRTSIICNLYRYSLLQSAVFIIAMACIFLYNFIFLS